MSEPFKLEELVDLTERYKKLYRGQISDVKIENLVLKGTVNQLLNLSALAERLIHLGPQYEVDKFSSLIFTSFSMAVLLFQQCSFLCVGAKDIIDVLQYNRRLAQEIRQAAYPDFKILSLDVVNAVVNISLDNLDGTIDVKKFADDNPVTCTYIPGKFPGARYLSLIHI
jgi:TATA-box binding protein (TBP) (component of TFIID and TFIIIB)